jgi:ABC-2 type transport system ATP-binding protein
VTAALVATKLTKRYGKTQALDNCSLSVPEGRIVALVGPNGAGKTTLLHLAVGLLKPTTGSISVLGETPSDGAMDVVGFVAQDAPLYRDFTATELFKMGSKLNRRWDNAIATTRLQALGVPLDRAVGKLSGGQRAQVALSLALAKRPQMLLLDEPLASLDPLARREFLQTLMDAAATDAMTIVLSSHLLTDLERVCDYLIVLQAGRVQVLGEIDDLIDSHKVLVGPARKEPKIVGVDAIVHASRKGRQETLLVRTNGRKIQDPDWEINDVALEEILLAYLADPTAGVLPRPEGIDHEVDA